MQTAAQKSVSDVYSFRCEGKKIILQHSGREHILYFSKGLNYILTLLEYPELNIPYANLETNYSTPEKVYSQFSSPQEIRDQQLNVQNGFLSVPMTDLQTIKEVKQELINVINELAELEENCDYPRADELRDRYEKLSNYLQEVYHKDCKIRHFTSEESKIKRRVVRAINRALAEIDMLEPELAKELSKSIEFRRTICYHQRRKIEVRGYWN